MTFASATQQFDTSTSAGMLMLNILLSFAQYERELTRERTLSKMAGRAERGLWNGGMVPIGFDYCAEVKALTANEREAEIVQFAFERFIETKSPSLVANEANSRGYRTKKRQVVARDGATKEIGGNRFDEDTVKAIIRNPLYKGVIRYDGKLFPGTHSPIVAPETWDRANQYVGQAREDDGTRNRDEHVHLLKGIAKCGVCGTTMTPYPAGRRARTGSRICTTPAPRSRRKAALRPARCGACRRGSLRRSSRASSSTSGPIAPCSRAASRPPIAKR